MTDEQREAMEKKLGETNTNSSGNKSGKNG